MMKLVLHGALCLVCCLERFAPGGLAGDDGPFKRNLPTTTPKQQTKGARRSTTAVAIPFSHYLLVEIKNVEEFRNENLKATVARIGECIGVEEPWNSIVSVRRIPHRHPFQPRIILLETATRKDRTEWVKKGSKYNGIRADKIDRSFSSKKLYINSYLSEENVQMLHEAKALAKEMGARAYRRDDRIYIAHTRMKETRIENWPHLKRMRRIFDEEACKQRMEQGFNGTTQLDDHLSNHTNLMDYVMTKANSSYEIPSFNKTEPDADESNHTSVTEFDGSTTNSSCERSSLSTTQPDADESNHTSVTEFDGSTTNSSCERSSLSTTQPDADESNHTSVTEFHTNMMEFDESTINSICEVPSL